MCFNDMYVYGLLIKYVAVLLCFLGKFLIFETELGSLFLKINLCVYCSTKI